MRFIVDIPPTGKARPRMTRGGHVYTPKGTTEAEMYIALCYRLQCDKEVDGGDIERHIPVFLTVEAYFPVPKTFTQKQRREIAAGKLFPTKKPDADNILKLVGDALNGVAYEDDAQVVQMTCTKKYSTNGIGYMAVTVGGIRGSGEEE